jgi:flagellar hook assembly protein FlgD
VKIFTVSGRLVRRLAAGDENIQGYQAFWDGRNTDGEWVGSGVYLVAAYLAEGRSGVGKVAVIRRQ